MCNRNLAPLFHPDVYLSLALEVLMFKLGCKSVFVLRKWLVTQTLVTRVKVVRAPRLCPECSGGSDADPGEFTLNGHQMPCVSEQQWYETAGCSEISGQRKTHRDKWFLQGWNKTAAKQNSTITAKLAFMCKCIHRNLKKKIGEAEKDGQCRVPLLTWQHPPTTTTTRYFPQRRSQWPTGSDNK